MGYEIGGVTNHKQYSRELIYWLLSLYLALLVYVNKIYIRAYRLGGGMWLREKYGKKIRGVRKEVYAE